MEHSFLSYCCDTNPSTCVGSYEKNRGRGLKMALLQGSESVDQVNRLINDRFLSHYVFIKNNRTLCKTSWGN